MEHKKHLLEQAKISKQQERERQKEKEEVCNAVK
jgi:hypothetical protein